MKSRAILDGQRSCSRRIKYPRSLAQILTIAPHFENNDALRCSGASRNLLNPRYLRPPFQRSTMLNPRALTHAQLADIVADVQAILWQESRMRELLGKRARWIWRKSRMDYRGVTKGMACASDARDKRAGVYGNRIHWELCSNPPLVLKTRAGTSRANTPETLILR